MQIKWKTQSIQLFRLFLMMNFILNCLRIIDCTCRSLTVYVIGDSTDGWTNRRIRHIQTNLLILPTGILLLIW